MDNLQLLTYIVVGFTFVLYIGIAVWSRGHQSPFCLWSPQ